MTTLFAVSSDEKVVWLIALGIAFVVVLVVIALLSLLSSIVTDIDDNVDDLWTVTKRMAQNTTGLYQLAGTGSIVRALREEALRQDKLFESNLPRGLER